MFSCKNLVNSVLLACASLYNNSAFVNSVEIKKAAKASFLLFGNYGIITTDQRAVFVFVWHLKCSVWPINIQVSIKFLTFYIESRVSDNGPARVADL